jgi:hypothetical protein
MRWLDNTNTLLVTNTVGSGATTRVLDLEAGTYYIEVARPIRGIGTGSYFITANFAAAENTPRAVNNTIANAESLTFAQSITGFLSHQNRVDIFKIELAQPGRVTLDLTRPAAGGFYDAGWGEAVHVKWLNVNGVEMVTDRVGSGAFRRHVDLEAGTYFIEVSRDNIRWTGRYFLTATFAASGRTTNSPINAIATAQPMNFGESVTGFLTHQERVNLFRITVPAGSSRDVTVNLTRPAVGGIPDGSWGQLNQRTTVRWLDVNGVQFGTIHHIQSGDFSNSRSLAPGTYYVEVSNLLIWFTGAYYLEVNMT